MYSPTNILILLVENQYYELISVLFFILAGFTDVLTSPANLKQLLPSDVPNLRSDINLRAYQLEG